MPHENFSLCIDEVLKIIPEDANGDKLFHNILTCCKKLIPSEIWQEYDNMNLENDVIDMMKWVEKSINECTAIKDVSTITGIYLGLDTLSMDMGDLDSSNIEIAFSTKSDIENVKSLDWIWNCKEYRENHLIGGLFHVAESFNYDLNKYNSAEISSAEYLIFLSYSGLIIKETFLRLKIEHIPNFVVAWGFHDGDIFSLLYKKDNKVSIVEF